MPEKEEKEEKKQDVKILLVEDTEEHVLLITNALEEWGVKKRFFVCRDGEEALDFLYNRGNFTSREQYPKPTIIILDLQLPKLDGLEVLKQIKSEERLKDIPVVVLTVSERDEDIVRAYQSHAKGYLLKSVLILPKKGRMKGLLSNILSML